jgi:hypothetical protein
MQRAPELLSLENLERRSGLNAADWQRLAGARDIEVIVALIIKALLKKKRGVRRLALISSRTGMNTIGLGRATSKIAKCSTSIPTLTPLTSSITIKPSELVS